MVGRALYDIAFSGTKQLLVGCREQLGKNNTDIVPLQKLQNKIKKIIIALKRKSMFLFEKIDKNLI